MTFTQHLLSKSHSSTCSKDTETHRPWHGFPSTKTNVLWLLIYKVALDAWHVLPVLAAKKSLIHLPTPVILSFPSCLLACLLHRARLFVTPWTVAHYALLSMEFSSEVYWSGLPSPGNLPNGRLSRGPRRSNPHLFHLLHWQVDSLSLNQLVSPVFPVSVSIQIKKSQHSLHQPPPFNLYMRFSSNRHDDSILQEMSKP